VNVGVFEQRTRIHAARRLDPFVSGERGRGIPLFRLGWVALLAIALFWTSFEAKAGLYRPSEAHLISKAFKVSECRLERAVPDPPIAMAHTAVSLQEDFGGQPEAAPSGHSATPPRRLPFSRSHFFRPPPVRF